MNQPHVAPATNGAATPIPDTVAAIAERIVRAVQPLQIILFGSHARGDADRRSDVDFLIVIRDADDKQRVWDEARDALSGSKTPCDVAVTTPDALRRYGDLVGMIFRPALREGKVLYDAAAPIQWDRSGRPVTLEVNPVSEADRLAETRRWLRQARGELRTAELAAQSPDQDPSPACYLAQQAAEKALKAALVFLQVQYPLTHELDVIRRDIPLGWSVREEFRNLKKLSDWSFKARYPGPWRRPSRRDAAEATRLARAIYETVLRDLAAHGFRQRGSR